MELNEPIWDYTSTLPCFIQSAVTTEEKPCHKSYSLAKLNAHLTTQIKVLAY